MLRCIRTSSFWSLFLSFSPRWQLEWLNEIFSFTFFFFFLLLSLSLSRFSFPVLFSQPFISFGIWFSIIINSRIVFSILFFIMGRSGRFKILLLKSSRMNIDLKLLGIQWSIIGASLLSLQSTGFIEIIYRMRQLWSINNESRWLATLAYRCVFGSYGYRFIFIRMSENQVRWFRRRKSLSRWWFIFC